MSLNPEKIETQVQKFDAGEIVDLFEMDLTALDGSILRFTSGVDETGIAIVWNTHTYLPLPIEITGFEVNSNAAFPRPSMQIANVNNTITAVLLEFDNLIGVPVRRIRTFSHFLDNGAAPDPTAKYLDEIYVIERKTGHTKFMVGFELASSIDAAGAVLPGRTIQKNGCHLIYRVWDSVNQVFVQGTCPYAGDDKFKSNDEATASELEDACGKRVSSCDLRFPNIVLPIQAFPGVGAVR